MLLRIVTTKPVTHGLPGREGADEILMSPFLQRLPNIQECFPRDVIDLIHTENKYGGTPSHIKDKLD